MKSSSIADHRSSDLSVSRRELGEMLRDLCQSRSMTLRDVSVKARVSLDYLSEIEHGQREASSKSLTAICYTLGVSVSFVLREVVDRIALQGGVFVGEISQTLPVGLLCSSTPAIQFTAFSRGATRNFRRIP